MSADPPRTTPIPVRATDTTPDVPTQVIDTPPPTVTGITLCSRAATRPLPDVPGYKIICELGSGGMGVVYLAEQLGVGRLVALKMLRAGVLADAEARARFGEEARIVARLRHPHIVQLYEFNSDPNQPYVTLEYVDGPTLARHLAGKPHPPEWAAAVVEQLARAMQYAHEQGVVHRDLKPANVLLVSGEGVLGTTHHSPLTTHQPKITDFGLAKVLGDSPVHTETGFASGTPGYMAPEQIRGERENLGPWTDVYALGVILYECLTGGVPFRGSNVAAVMLATTVAEPTAPGKLRPGLPRDLETICLKCLAKKPAERYLTAGSLAADLARFREGRPIAARRAGVAERVWKFARRNPIVSGLAVALVASLAVGFAVASVLYLRAEDRREAAEHAGQQESLARAAAEQAAADARAAENRTAAALAELTARQTDLEAVNAFVLDDILAAPRPFDRAGRGAVTLRDALDDAAARIGKRFADKPGLAAAAEHVVGESYRQLAEYPAAIQHLTRAVELREQHTPNDHTGLARSRRSLALAWSVTGRVNDAIALHRRVLDDLAEHPDPAFEATVRRDLGLCLNLAGDPTAAVEMLAASHALCIKVHGPDHAHTLAALLSVAAVHLKAGRYDRVAEIARDVAARAEAEHEPDALITGYALGMLGAALGHLDPPEAVVPLRRAVDIHARQAGPYHPDTLNMTATLGVILVRQNQYAEAETLLRPAAEAAPRVLGPGHLSTFMIRGSLAQCLFRAKKWDEVEKLMEELVDAHRKYRPDDLAGAENVLAKVRKAKQAQRPVAPPPREGK